MLAPTCFGSSLPSSGIFWICLSYVKMRTGMVVYHIMWLSGLCVIVSWFSLVCFPAECTQLGTLKAVSFYLLHNVSTLNQCWKLSCGTVVCKHFAKYQDYANYRWDLTLSQLMSYIHGAPCKARNFYVEYIYIYGLTFGNAESSLFLFAAQCFNTKSMRKVIPCHSCV
jgi:hypothetical protein